MDPPTYEAIGQDYSRHRAADPRIVGRLVRMLGPPENGALIEVGAGTGNYAAALAKHGYRVVAVEPSATMRSQAEDVSGVCWVEAVAERLPLPDGYASGVVCVLALHHFADVEAALSEMRRVSGGGPIVIFTFDPRAGKPFWFADYFPELWREAHETFPPLGEVVGLVEKVTGRRVEVSEFPCPTTCETGSRRRAGGGHRRTWTPGCGRPCRASRSRIGPPSRKGCAVCTRTWSQGRGARGTGACWGWRSSTPATGS
jgi:ubiquinone/menaquinone biosynthesis C-methylase UbiE